MGLFLSSWLRRFDDDNDNEDAEAEAEVEVRSQLPCCSDKTAVSSTLPSSTPPSPPLCEATRAWADEWVAQRAAATAEQWLQGRLLVAEEAEEMEEEEEQTALLSQHQPTHVRPPRPLLLVLGPASGAGRARLASASSPLWPDPTTGLAPQE